MNFEFQSTGKSTLNGLRGIGKKADSSATQHAKGQEKSAQFRDLLDRSKQDIRQADTQLEKARGNPKEIDSTTHSNRRENKQAVTDRLEARSKERPSGEAVTEEAKREGKQLSDPLLTLELSQMISMQNLQGGVDPSLAGLDLRLDLKLGQGEMTIPEVLTNQEQVIQLAEISGQWQTTPELEILPEFNEMGDAKFQVLNQNLAMTENLDAAALPGLSGIIESELVTSKDITKDISNQINDTPELIGQTKAEVLPKLSATTEAELATVKDISNQVNGVQEEVSQTNKVADSRSQETDEIIQSNGNNTGTGKSDSLVNEMGNADSTEEGSTQQTKIENLQKNPINQTENQSPGERGLQDLNLRGITTNTGSEVQQSNKVELAHQVEQKILHNFEPNKPMTLQMTLSPDNLGDIDIKLSYNQGKLIIDIMAASLETQKLLGNQINNLVRSLALQNVKVETVNVNTPVEATENGESMSSLLNDGSQFSQQHHNTPLKEHYSSKGSIRNNPFNNETEDSNDELISLAQNLQYQGQRRINYLV